MRWEENENETVASRVDVSIYLKISHIFFIITAIIYAVT